VNLEITPESLTKVTTWTAYGVSSVVTFFVTLFFMMRRVFHMNLFKSTAGDAMDKTVCAAERSISVANELKVLAQEIRENTKSEAKVFEKLLGYQEELLKNQQRFTEINAEMIGTLRTLASARM